MEESGYVRIPAFLFLGEGLNEHTCIHKNQEEGYKMYQIKKKAGGGRGHGF